MVESWYDALQASATPAVDVEALKADGLATIERRTAMAAARAATCKIAELKREGATVVAQRANMAIKAKAMMLKNEGAATVAQRAEMVAALKVATLKLEGAATVVRRADLQAACAERMPLRKGVVVPIGEMTAFAPEGFE